MFSPPAPTLSLQLSMTSALGWCICMEAGPEDDSRGKESNEGSCGRDDSSCAGNSTPPATPDPPRTAAPPATPALPVTPAVWTVLMIARPTQ